jgi:FkbM family methyltransferase
MDRALITKWAIEPYNKHYLWQMGLMYEDHNQHATAISFYLRIVEEFPDTFAAYRALCRMSLCFEYQGGRPVSTEHALLQAVAMQPHKQAAWFLLARFYERTEQWQRAYTAAETGLRLEDRTLPDVEYNGRWNLLFEKAVAAYWIGRRDEARKIFYALLTSFAMDEKHRAATFTNLERLGVNVNDGVHPLEPVITLYRKYFGATAPVVFDIGSRDGDDAQWLADRLASQQVFAVEANPIAANLIRERHSSVQVLEFAAHCETGEAEFNQVISENLNDMGCSSLGNAKVQDAPTITVQLRRMDEVLRSLNLAATPIDVVKIDVEGWSWQVLEGFGHRLRDVKLFHIETEQTEGYHGEHHNSLKIQEFMLNAGFVLADISYEWGWEIQDEIWVNPRFAVRNHECFKDEPW